MRPLAPGILMITLLAVAMPAGCGPSAADKVASEDPAVRVEGLQELAAQDTEASLDRASDAIAHEDVSTACAAVRAVSRMSHRQAVVVLSRAAAEDRRPEVRREAALALSYGPEAASADVLRQTVRADADPGVRTAAATSLGRIGTLDDVEGLLAVALRDPDPEVQAHAVGALERLLGIGFTFNPRDPDELRRATLEQIRQAVVIRTKVLRGTAPPVRAQVTP
jgi:HEAT repeat protein